MTEIGAFQKLVVFERRIDIFQSFSEPNGCRIAIRADTSGSFAQVSSTSNDVNEAKRATSF